MTDIVIYKLGQLKCLRGRSSGLDKPFNKRHKSDSSGHQQEIVNNENRDKLEKKNSTDDISEQLKLSDWLRQGTVKAVEDAAVDTDSEVMSIAISESPSCLNAEDGAEAVLQKFYGPNSSWKSLEQQVAMRRVLAGVSPLLVILPTGGGKSMLFEGIAFHDRKKVHIVIVPFVALKNDLYDRARDSGLRACCWKDERSIENDTCLVFVTVEGSVQKRFRQWVKKLWAEERLGAIFVDEAHMVLLTSSFRENFKDLDWFSALGTQLVLLTATLPSYMVDNLRQELLLKSLQVVRRGVNREAISYQVYTTDKAKREQNLGSLLNHFKKYATRDDRALIYTQTVEDLERLVKEYNTCRYNAEYSGKGKEYERWVSGRNKIMVATSALGAGIDVPCIRLVIHYKSPYMFIDFVQGSGRAGRDGKRSKSVCLLAHDEHKRGWNAAVKKEFPIEVKALEDFLKTTGCRRAVISDYFNGYGQDCVVGSDQLCDNCLSLVAKQRKRLRSGDSSETIAVTRTAEPKPLGHSRLMGKKLVKKN